MLGVTTNMLDVELSYLCSISVEIMPQAVLLMNLIFEVSKIAYLICCRLLWPFSQRRVTKTLEIWISLNYLNILYFLTICKTYATIT